jgi:hypothetical protein
MLGAKQLFLLRVYGQPQSAWAVALGYASVKSRTELSTPQVSSQGWVG